MPYFAYHRLTTVLFVVLCQIQTCVWGQQQEESSSTEKLDPKAEQILRSAGQYLAKLDSLQVKARGALKLHAQQGVGSEVACEKVIRAQRPNKLAILTKPVMMFGTVSVFCDGKQLYTMRLPSKNYAVQKAPDTLAAIVEQLPSTDLLGMDIEKALLSGKTLRDTVVEGARQITYVGSDQVDGTPCHHLQLMDDQNQFQLWIQEGTKPVIRRVRADMSEILAADNDEWMTAMFKGAMFELNLTDWDVKPEFADDDFAFTPPAGATKVEQLFDKPKTDQQKDSP